MRDYWGVGKKDPESVQKSFERSRDCSVFEKSLKAFKAAARFWAVGSVQEAFGGVHMIFENDSTIGRVQWYKRTIVLVFNLNSSPKTIILINLRALTLMRPQFLPWERRFGRAG